MPFTTECPFCGHQCQAPDRALYGSGRCPKCSDFFTVVPVEGAPRPSLSAGTVTAPQAASPTAPAQPAAVPAPPPETASVPFRVPAPHPGRLAAPARPPVLPDRGLDPVAVGSAALAVVAAVCWLAGAGVAWVVTPGVLAVVAGLAGLLRAEGARLLLPAAGFLTATAVLLGVAVFGTRSGGGPGDGGDPGALRVVPLAGPGVPGAPTDPEWVDASRAALQLGTLRVQVVSAATTPGASASLAVSVRVFRLGIGGGGGGAGRPTLTDKNNKPYALRSEPVTRGPDPRKPFATLDFADSVYQFDLPPAGADPYRFELPVDGTPFRFTIPAAMVRRDGQPPR
jgi:hypothetical protein